MDKHWLRSCSGWGNGFNWARVHLVLHCLGCSLKSLSFNLPRSCFILSLYQDFLLFFSAKTCLLFSETLLDHHQYLKSWSVIFLNLLLLKSSSLGRWWSCSSWCSSQKWSRCTSTTCCIWPQVPLALPWRCLQMVPPSFPCCYQPVLVPENTLSHLNYAKSSPTSPPDSTLVLIRHLGTATRDVLWKLQGWSSHSAPNWLSM